MNLDPNSDLRYGEGCCWIRKHLRAYLRRLHHQDRFVILCYLGQNFCLGSSLARRISSAFHLIRFSSDGSSVPAIPTSLVDVLPRTDSASGHAVREGLTHRRSERVTDPQRYVDPLARRSYYFLQYFSWSCPPPSGQIGERTGSDDIFQECILGTVLSSDLAY